MNPSSLSADDQVTWTHTRSEGKGIRMTTRQGKITSITDDIATVKMRNGRTYNVHVSNLRKLGEKTSLTQLFENLAKSSGAST